MTTQVHWFPVRRFCAKGAIILFLSFFGPLSDLKALEDTILQSYLYLVKSRWQVWFPPQHLNFLACYSREKLEEYDVCYDRSKAFPFVNMAI